MRIAWLLLSVSLVGACATSPTGRSQLMLVSPDQAVVASRQAYLAQIGELDKQGKLAQDPELLKWIENITSRLVAQAVAMRPDTSKWEWSVAVIDDPEVVNAWCMAGGRMAIYTGLIRKVDPTEDELAQVMAHEIAHALANHTAEKMSVAMASQAGVLAAAVVSDRPGAAVAGAALAAQLAIGCRTAAPRRAKPTRSASSSPPRPASIRRRPRRYGRKWGALAAAHRPSS